VEAPRGDQGPPTTVATARWRPVATRHRARAAPSSFLALRLIVDDAWPAGRARRNSRAELTEARASCEPAGALLRVQGFLPPPEPHRRVLGRRRMTLGRAAAELSHTKLDAEPASGGNASVRRRPQPGQGNLRFFWAFVGDRVRNRSLPDAIRPPPLSSRSDGTRPPVGPRDGALMSSSRPRSASNCAGQASCRGLVIVASGRAMTPRP